MEAAVMLDTANRVNTFTELMFGCKTRAELILDERIVNARSILSVLSLDLSQPLTLRVDTNGLNHEDLEKLEQIVEPFKVKS